MRKIYKKLTDEQRKNGIIFTSTLSENTTDQGGTTHEVFKTDTDKNEVIDRLLDDKFFNSSPYKYNVIRN